MQLGPTSLMPRRPPALAAAVLPAHMLLPQALGYDFQFYRQPVPVSVCPVVLSEARSLMRDALPLSVPLAPLRPLPSGPEQVGGGSGRAWHEG